MSGGRPVAGPSGSGWRRHRVRRPGWPGRIRRRPGHPDGRSWLPQGRRDPVGGRSGRAGQVRRDGPAPGSARTETPGPSGR